MLRTLSHSIFQDLSPPLHSLQVRVQAKEEKLSREMCRLKAAHITAHIIFWPEHLTGSQPTTRKLRNVICGTQREISWRLETKTKHCLGTVSHSRDCDPASRAMRQTPVLESATEWLFKQNRRCLGFRKFIYCTFKNSMYSLMDFYRLKVFATSLCCSRIPDRNSLGEYRFTWAHGWRGSPSWWGRPDAGVWSRRPHCVHSQESQRWQLAFSWLSPFYASRAWGHGMLLLTFQVNLSTPL